MSSFFLLSFSSLNITHYSAFCVSFFHFSYLALAYIVLAGCRVMFLSTSGRRFVVTFCFGVSVVCFSSLFLVLAPYAFFSSFGRQSSKIFPASLVQSPNDPSCRAGVRGVNCRKQGMKRGYWVGEESKMKKEIAVTQRLDNKRKKERENATRLWAK